MEMDAAKIALLKMDGLARQSEKYLYAKELHFVEILWLIQVKSVMPPLDLNVMMTALSKITFITTQTLRILDEEVFRQYWEPNHIMFLDRYGKFSCMIMFNPLFGSINLSIRILMIDGDCIQIYASNHLILIWKAMISGWNSLSFNSLCFQNIFCIISSFIFVGCKWSRWEKSVKSNILP